MSDKNIRQLNRELENTKKEFDTAIEELKKALELASEADKKKIQAFLINSTSDTGKRLDDNNNNTIVSEDLSGCAVLQPSININQISDENFFVIRKNNNYDAYNRYVPGAKLYIGAQCSELVFLNPINLSDCRAIIESPGIEIMSISNSYISDPSLTIIANVAEEDLSILANLGIVSEAQNEAEKVEKQEKPEKNKKEKRNNKYQYSEDELKELRFYVDYLEQYRLPPLSENFIMVKGASSNQSTKHDTIKPRMATPFFAGIPLKSNNRVYGPWTNDPTITLNNNLSDNLFGNIKIEKNNDYVPWKYGGIRFLEKVVGFNIAYDVNYQSVLENGRVSIAGPPIFGIGGSFNPNIVGNNRNSTFDNALYSISSKRTIFFDANLGVVLTYSSVIVNSSNDYGFPIISNISIQTSNDGIKTSYSFQTYNPKTGLFNKELTDRARILNNNISKINQEINKINNKISNKSLLEKLDILTKSRSSREPYKVDDRRTRFYGTSPVELVVGQAQQYLKRPINNSWDKTENPGEKSLNPSDYNLNDTKTEGYYSSIYYDIRTHHWAGIITGDEIGSELLEDYSSKSAMSLDGLLSPVSFYPTKKSGTYHLSTLVTGSGTTFGQEITNNDKIIGNGQFSESELVCPKCNNTRKTLIYNRNTDKLSEPLIVPCSLCCKAKIDIKILDKNPSTASSLPDINLYSLNPIVVPSGEFRNPYALPDDMCRHSIMSINRGDIPHTNSDNFVIHNNIRKDSINKDYHLYDIDKKAIDNTWILNNQRFMALRGPLMLHAWGFDKDGYPTPNANDMPYYINDNGIPLRFRLVNLKNSKTFGQNDLGSPGVFIPKESIVFIDTEAGPVSVSGGTDPLGDIITHQYEWKGTGNGTNVNDIGKWVKKSTKSKYFYRNWAQKPDIWPVGPIDLRWDNERRVWDAGGGCKEEILPPFIISNKNDITTLQEFLDNRTNNKCPYKMVYITLEQDMTKEDNFESTIPARAFIDDIEYSKEPLPNNYRRLVYVIDTAGYTAPRGTKLLCRYNRDNGFYEPITKPILTAMGIISNNQAKIEMSYTQGRRSGAIPNYVVNINNIFNLSVQNGDKGLFHYINGKWTLVNKG